MLPVLAAALCGVFNGLLVTRLSVQPIVATLVLFIAGRGIAQVVTDGSLQAFNNPAFQWIALGPVAGVPAQVFLMLALVALFAWIVRKTLFGQYLLVTGGNEQAAYLSGIPTARVKMIAYTLCAALAGLAGLISISVNSSSDANVIGLGSELDAIAAVAVGGTALTGGKAYIGGHADRRADHPVAALHAARARHSRRRRARGEGRHHHRRRCMCSGAQREYAREHRS